MSTRYIVDAEGRPVEAIMNLDELRWVFETQRRAAEALARIDREVCVLVGKRHDGGFGDAEQYKRDLQALEDAKERYPRSSVAWRRSKIGKRNEKPFEPSVKTTKERSNAAKPS